MPRRSFVSIVDLRSVFACLSSTSMKYTFPSSHARRSSGDRTEAPPSHGIREPRHVAPRTIFVVAQEDWWAWFPSPPQATAFLRAESSVPIPVLHRSHTH